MRLPDSDCDLVVSDSASGARRLVEHLIAVGHRDIAHLTDADDTSTGRERLRGYREALAAAGIPFREDLVFRTTVDQIGGYRATQQVLALDPLPTAIFTVNNMTVVGAMQALRERGLTVPEDMALVCFDDVEHLAVLSPFLTVIDQPAETLGSLGAQLLLERIAGKAGSKVATDRAPDRPRRSRLLRDPERHSESHRRLSEIRRRLLPRAAPAVGASGRSTPSRLELNAVPCPMVVSPKMPAAMLAPPRGVRPWLSTYGGSAEVHMPGGYC